MDRTNSPRGPGPARIPAIDLERYSGTPLGDLRIVCRSCKRQLTAIDKLSAINRESIVWYQKGAFGAYCYGCTVAVIV